MNKKAKVTSTIGWFLLTVGILLTIIDGCCFARSFYEYEYAKNNTTEDTGMDTEAMLESTDTLLDYLRDERNDIIVEEEVNGEKREVFNERETIHMVDVKVLYQNAITVRNILVGCGIVLLALSVYFSKSFLKGLNSGYRLGVSLVGITIMAIIVYVLADFTSFWTNFHQVFFDNDYWLLDPRTSIMINLFPESFFFDLVIRIILWFVGIYIVLTLLLEWGYRKHA